MIKALELGQQILRPRTRPESTRSGAFRIPRGCVVWPSEALEAETRRLMAKHASITERGWSTRQERAVLHIRIDSTLDAWQAAKDREACQAWEPSLAHLPQPGVPSAASTDAVAPSDDLPVDGDWRNW